MNKIDRNQFLNYIFLYFQNNFMQQLIFKLSQLNDFISIGKNEFSSNDGQKC